MSIKNKKTGRPPIWTTALEDAVVAAIEETGSQTAAAAKCGIHRATIDRHENACEDFASRIARARRIGYDARAEKAVADAKAAEDAAKGRLAFDAERWILSKIDPARYGDKQQVEHAGGVTVTVATGVPDGAERSG
jgi:hypothetical protein